LSSSISQPNFYLIGPQNEAARQEYINEQSSKSDNLIANSPFDLDWFPSAWIVFVYLAGPSDVAEGANPLKPRSQQAMVEEETRTLKELAYENSKRPQTKTVRRAIRSQLGDGKISEQSVQNKNSDSSRKFVISFEPVQVQETLKDRIAIVKEKIQWLKGDLGYSDDHVKVKKAKRELTNLYDETEKAFNKKERKSSIDAISISSVDQDGEEVSLLNESMEKTCNESQDEMYY
jgi:hypothetical protein